MRKHVPLIFLLIISLLPLVDLAHPGLPVTHDGQDHVARIANFYQSLTEGNSIPRWAGNLNWGYGHPILMFLYPLPSYIASLFHMIGFTLVDSTKLVFAATYIGSILLFYLWARTQWNQTAGFIGALLYGFAPYRFVDLYVRGALGEHVAFLFPPLIFYGLLRLAKQGDLWSKICIELGIAGLLLSHNAVSLMMLPIIGFYVWYIWQQERHGNWRYVHESVIAISLGMLLSAFFWLPAYREGRYTLRDIVTKGDISNRFVEPLQFFVSSWSYGNSELLNKTVGIGGWITVIGSLWYLIRYKVKQHGILMVGFLSAFFLSLFLMTRWSLPIWNTITILGKFQFPWRFLSVSILCTSVLGSAVSICIPKKYHAAFCVVVAVGIIVSTHFMWQAKAYRLYPDNFFTGVYNGTTDTGESSPIWSVRFMESRPKNVSEVISGSASIIPVSRISTTHGYRVKAFTRSQIVENTLYFPGWTVYVDGVPVPIEYQDQNHRGLVTYWVDTGMHTINIVFLNTKVRSLASAMSIATIAVSVLYVIIPIWKKRKV